MRRFLRAALLAAAVSVAGSSAAFAQAAARPASADLTPGNGGYLFAFDGRDARIAQHEERQKGVSALKAKRYRQAVVALGKLSDVAPDDPGVWRLLGAAYAGQERWDHSRKAYKRAVALDPNDIAGHAGLGLALLNLKDPKAQAENDWLKARTLACNNTCPEAGVLQALATRGPFAPSDG